MGCTRCDGGALMVETPDPAAGSDKVVHRNVMQGLLVSRRLQLLVIFDIHFFQNGVHHAFKIALVDVDLVPYPMS